MSGTEVVLWLSLALCVYPYALYPALLWIVSRARRRPVAKGTIRPAVTVLIPARDEADVIGEKLENTLALDYPADRLEVLVVSDGSTDGTEAIVQAVDDDRVRLLARPPRGKIAALNAGAARASGEILVFTDADIRLEPEGLARLVENFADPEVGGAVGVKSYRGAAGSGALGAGESLYWRFDTWQKLMESRVGSVFGADGALYALRRELYEPLEDPAQADDLALSARVALRGRRLVMEPAARSSEPAPVDRAKEFRRKIRITTHSVRALLGLGGGLVTNGFHSVALCSHKLLRYLVPFFLVALYGSTLALAGTHVLYTGLLIAQTLLYAAGVAGALLQGTEVGRWRILTIPYFVCFVNAAALLGVLSALGGRRETAWRSRGDREAP